MLKNYTIKCNSILSEDLVDIIEFLDDISDSDFKNITLLEYKNYYIGIDHDNNSISVFNKTKEK